MADKSEQDRGQASVEFMMALTVTIAVFLVASYFIYFKIARTFDYRLFLHGTHVVNSFASSINSVSAVGSGYSMVLTIDPMFSGSQPFLIRLYEDEPQVFIEGGAFSRGNQLFFSSPISTIDVGCTLAECQMGCNETDRERCIYVNESIEARLTNFDEKVYFSPRYNLEQPENNVYADITPFSGYNDPFHAINDTVENIIVAGNDGAVMYLWEDEGGGNLSVVFKIYDVDTLGGVLADLNYTGSPKITFSEDSGEFFLSAEPEGNWGTSFAGDSWDGGVLDFGREGFRMCIQPTLSGSLYWLNPVQEIQLDGDEEVCITYP